jgi:predicted transcriptional regulator of viral defense system
MYLRDFFYAHRIFTSKELRAFLADKQNKDQASYSTIANLLVRHAKKGHILKIRRGLYYSIPFEFQGGKKARVAYVVDPYLVASKLKDDAIIAYHSALSLHGVAYAYSNTHYYLTQSDFPEQFAFQGITYKAVHLPAQLLEKKMGEFEVLTINRAGISIRVTSLERTLVDVLDRPALGLSVEETWRSLQNIAYLNVAKVIAYATLLAKSSIAAKVGFFLDAHREQFMVTQEQLETLRRLRPKTKQYFYRQIGRPQRFIPEWNLIVPEIIINLKWEEYHGLF